MADGLKSRTRNMDSYAGVSAQTTQSTNTSDSSYPILFQFQPTTVTEAKDVTTNTTLESPYVRRKSTVQARVMKRVRIGLALVGILSIVMVIFVLSFYLPTPQKLPDDYYKQGKVTIDSLQVDLKLFQILVHNSFAKTTLKIQTNLSSAKSAQFGIKRTNTSITMKRGTMLFNISLLRSENNVKCWNLSYSNNDGDPMENCVLFENSTWYGIGERIYQTWLVNEANVTMVPFTTYDIAQGKENKSYGGVIEPYLIGSNGFGILIDRKNPISMSINNPIEGRLCFQIPSHRERPKRTSLLQFTACMAQNVVEVQKYMIGNFFKKAGKVPDTRMLISPIWSTWAKYKADITQDKVMQFANEINKYKMPISQLEIDDKYSTRYGDFDFDPVKFKNPKKMIEDLHAMGMRVTIWVYPFANLDSKALKEGSHYWVQVDHVPGIVLWWNGLGAILDMTNTEGVFWFKKRLKYFKDTYGLDGFKFDAGEVRYLPKLYTFNKTLDNINFFTSKYVKLATSFGNLGEVRVGYGNQDCAVFARLLDRTSKWGIDNGLKSVVTATLTFGILGYPFVLPDMVGGNAYIGLPDKELYIRWTQLNAFLPSIQFSLAPWDYDNETVSHIKAALEVRKNISNDILKFADVAAKDNYPIIRPLWWLAPEDKNALINDSEFLVGDMYLVAPVLEKGAKELNVFLINGKWQEMFGARKVHDVGKEGQNLVYKVDLSDIIYFKKLD